MIVFLVIVGCVLLSGTIVTAPLLLPWPAQLRWLLSARLMGAEALIADGFGGLQMTEAQVLAVERSAGSSSSWSPTPTARGADASAG